MLDKIIARIQVLGEELEKSASKHNAMLGAMQELKALYNEAVIVAPVVEAIIPQVTPVVDAIEEVVSSVE